MFKLIMLMFLIQWHTYETSFNWLGLTLEECTDKDLLQKKLYELDRQLKELNISFKTRYVPKTRKIELKDSLDEKVAYRDMLLRQGQFYKAKRQRLKVC